MKRFFVGVCTHHGADVLIVYTNEKEMPAFVDTGRLTDDACPQFVSLEGDTLIANVEIREDLPPVTLKEVPELPISWKRLLSLNNVPARYYE